MTPAQFKAVRAKLGLTQAAMAPYLGIGYAENISRMENGRRPIPWHIAQLMRCYDKFGLLEDEK